MKRVINGKEYEFRMTRKGIRAAERAGLKSDSISETPIEGVYYLWFAALHAEQPMVKSKCDDLLDDYLDDPTCPESFTDIAQSLVEDYQSVFS